ncbi:PQ loop repeat-containing protein 2 [Boothiomyces macroporosus]|uniref:PQ loop repeat-containing protein 2 n=1 Tax=Boothiomyces macroporosus TaxID=261099 RepID=A0AAD5YB42_9FUNG|nr:PQ loop repeat-containing protein 2 [Boothiomyces macroporosus]
MSCKCDPEFKDGYKYIQWIGTIFSDCVYTPIEQVSFYIAFVGLFCSLIAMFPQFYTNYKLKNVHGLSFGLVLLWTAGDIASLAGTILTRQLTTQKWTAIFFTIIDVAMMAQYIYYSRFYPEVYPSEYVQVPDVDEEEFEPSPSPSSSSVPGTLVAAAMVPGAAAMFLPLRSTVIELCNVTSAVPTEGKIIGYVLAIPQLIQNHKEQSVHGLSLYLFLLSIAGNVGYGVSIFLRMPPIDTEFFLSTFPYLVGSIGVTALDFGTLYQAYLYGGFDS